MVETCPTILVVDDEPDVRGVIQALLVASGYDVRLAADGREALSALAQYPEVDLVLTDLVMPNHEGIETIRAIRLRFPEVKVVAMSGAFGGGFLTAAKFLGAHASLAKPVGADLLRRTIRQVLDSGASTAVAIEDIQIPRY